MVGIVAAHFVYLLADLSVGILYKTGVQSVRNRGEVGGIFLCIVESLDFGLSDTASIEIAGGGGDKVDAVGLVYTLGDAVGVEHYVFEYGYGRRLQPDAGKLFAEKLAREFGHEFIHRIVVMDAVAEPYLFEVFLERTVVGVVGVAVVAGIGHFQSVAQRKIEDAILIPKDVASP